MEKNRQFEEPSTVAGSHASSTGGHDEEKEQDYSCQGADLNHTTSIEAQSLAGTQLPQPPDGGLHAWLKVVGGFLIYINIW